MKKLRLMVVDYDKANCELAEKFLSCEEIEVVAIAHDGVDCLAKLENTSVDIILTELMLPKMDGYLLMDCINSSRMAVKPKIFIMSNILTEPYLTAALEKGVTYYFFKPLEYSVMRKVILEKYNSQSIWQVMTKPDKHKQHGDGRTSETGYILDERISRIFLSIGIPAHIKGYQYLRCAIKKVMQEPTLINNITKQLYPNVAEEFASSPSKVERAIRHAIDVAWTRGHIDYINKLFGFKVYNPSDKPTNGEFIALVADKLMCEYSEER